jgi:NADH-quinone oxidoreductase subunit G
VKKGATLSVINTVDDDLLCPVAAKDIVKPSQMVHAVAAVAASLAKRLEKPAPIAIAQTNRASDEISAKLATGKNVAVLLGDIGQSSAEAAQIEALAASIAQMLGGTVGRLSVSGSATAAYVAGAVPSSKGKSANAALTKGAKAFVLIGCEPERDSATGAQALASLKAADKVVALTSFASATMKEYADVILPIAPFTETSGTYISQDATVQSFAGVVRPLGETRPGWKVLRVLGDLLHANVGAFNSSEDVKNAALKNFSETSLGARPAAIQNPHPPSGHPLPGGEGTLERVADLPIYHADSLVRRGKSLQLSAYGKQARVRMSSETAKQLGLTHGAQVRVEQGAYSATSTLTVDESVPTGAVRVPLATEVSTQLGAINDPIKVSAL